MAKTMRVWALSLELDSSMTMVTVSCGVGVKGNGLSKRGEMSVILGVGARVRFEFLWYGRGVVPFLAHNQLGGRILGVLLLFCSMVWTRPYGSSLAKSDGQCNVMILFAALLSVQIHH